MSDQGLFIDVQFKIFNVFYSEKQQICVVDSSEIDFMD